MSPEQPWNFKEQSFCLMPYLYYKLWSQLRLRHVCWFIRFLGWTDSVPCECILAHWEIPSSEMANTLTKEMAAKQQIKKPTSYHEVKTGKIINKQKWMQQQQCIKNLTCTFYSKLIRLKQVTTFRLNINHNRLNYSPLQAQDGSQLGRADAKLMTW